MVIVGGPAGGAVIPVELVAKLVVVRIAGLSSEVVACVSVVFVDGACGYEWLVGWVIGLLWGWWWQNLDGYCERRKVFQFKGGASD